MAYLNGTYGAITNNAVCVLLRSNRAAAGGGTLLEDDFNRSNADPLDGNWNLVYQAGSTDWTLTSNKAQYDTSNAGTNLTYAWYTTQASQTDHEVAGVQLLSAANGQHALAFRGDGDKTSYITMNSTTATQSMRLYKFVNGAFTQIGSTWTSGAGPHTVRGEAVGSAIKLYTSDGSTWTQRVSGTNSDLTGLYVGMWGRDGGWSGCLETIDDWKADNAGNIAAF